MQGTGNNLKLLLRQFFWEPRYNVVDFIAICILARVIDFIVRILAS